MKGLHVFFSGIVQGVGFRFTARHLAGRYNVGGWVVNLPDGRVELTAEGDSGDVDNFLNDLRKEFEKYIIDFQLEEIIFSGNYKNFQIKF